MPNAIDRFLKYVTYSTASDEMSQTNPSTEGQLAFARILAQECADLNLTNIRLTDKGYLYATLPSNCPEKSIASIGFIAHMDTSPDAPGKNIKPVRTRNYNGGDIVLQGLTLSPKEFPSLNQYIGETIITSDGTTLLGADDKAGIAEILAMAEYFQTNPQFPHGEIQIAFTPDEEIGQGAEYFDVKGFGADFAYTVDGGAIGELEYENFYAARADITITGKSVHPGYAKGIMQNAALIGAQFLSLFPQEETPSTTDGYEGYYHLAQFSGEVASAQLSIMIRDFDKSQFENRKKFILDAVKQINQLYPNCMEVEIKSQYDNMKTQLQDKMEIVELAKKAMLSCDVTPITEPVRGGTDGARLSFMGLPCPNLFAGGLNFHGPYEYIPEIALQKATEVLIAIVRLAFEENMQK